MGTSEIILTIGIDSVPPEDASKKVARRLDEAIRDDGQARKYWLIFFCKTK